MEWFGSPSHNLVIRVSLAVLLTDDLTGAPITGSNARVWISGQKPPVKKKDGRSVFVDLPEGEYVLHAEGGMYTPAQMTIRVIKDKTEAVTLRLAPNRLYPVPDGTLRIEGIAEPGAVVRIYTADKNTAYKLLSDVVSGSRVIGIYHPTGITLDGKLLRLLSPDGSGECIRVISAENSERFEYLLESELSAGFPKIGTVIAPVSECTADRSGSFMLLISRRQGIHTVICEVQTEGRSFRKELSIQDSSCIKADLTAEAKEPV